MRKIIGTQFMLLIALCLIFILSLTVKGEGTGNFPVPENGDWVIANTTIVLDEKIILNGNLSIEDDGILIFKNVTLIMNCSYDGEFHIEVKNGGEFNILDSERPTGDFDLVIGNTEGILNYYENIGTIFKPEWILINAVFSGLDVGWWSYPTFVDLDNDGDFDLTIGEAYGDIFYYENIGTVSEPLWQQDNSMISGLTIGNHVAPIYTDLDGDGDFDLTIGQMSGDILYYNNTGNLKQPVWTQENKMYNDIDSDASTAPILTDLDGDGDFDLIVGDANGNLSYFENMGNTAYPKWSEVMSMFSGINVGEYSRPSFADLDNDGDFDLTIGESEGTLFYYSNDGNLSETNWTENSTMFTGIDVGTQCAPTFVDLDNDYEKSNVKSNPSIIMSNNSFSYVFWVNEGAKFKIENSEIQGCGFLESGLKGIDFDLIVGKDDGTLQYYENSGSISNPKWEIDNSDFTGIDVGDRSTPTLADLDNDGDFDLIMGNKNGNLNYFENTGNALKPVWEEDGTMFSIIDTGLYSTPFFIDLDNDEDLDLTIGDSNGNLSYYENIGTAFIPEWNKNDILFNGIDVGIYSAPTFSDLDNDGDFDLIVGEHEGILNYYENIGTRFNPEWVYNNSMFTGIDVGLYSKPTFVNLDNDEDFDLIVGDYNGNINYFENTGNNTNPVWTVDNLIFSGIDVGDHSAISFADLDFDGFTMKNRGIYINANNTSIKNSKFSFNYDGLIIASKNNSVINNTFSQNDDCGLLFFNSSLNINNNNQFDSNNIGIRFTICKELLVNSTFPNSIYSDFILKSSNISVLNTTFNETNIDIHDSSLKVSWFLDIELINIRSNFIDGVNLTIKYKNNEILYEKIVNNKVKWIDFIEYIQINNKKNYKTPLKIFGKKRTIGKNFTKLNISNSLKLTLILIPYNDFEIYSEFSKKFGDPGEFLSYKIFIENWCELNDTIILEFSTNEPISPVLNKTAVLLTGFENKTVTISFLLPEETIPYEFDINIIGTSLSNPSISDEILLSTIINQVSDLSLVSDLYIPVVNPGETVSYEINIKNKGNIKDFVNISISGIPEEWIDVNKYNFTLGIGEENIVILNLTVPFYLEAFETMDFIFQAFSIDGSNSTLSLGFYINQRHQIDIIPNIYSNSVNPGETTSYIINITNYGNDIENIELGLSGKNHDWAYLSDKKVNIERNKSRYITLFVTSPYHALLLEKSYIFIETEINGIKFSSNQITTNVNQIHDVSMEFMGESIKNVDPRETCDYLIKIKNDGNGNENLKIKLTGKNSEWGEIINEIKLGVLEEKIMKLNVKSPNGALAFETAEIFIEAFSNNNLLDSLKCISTINQIFNIILKTDTNEKFVVESEITEFKIEIINNGNGKDTLLLKFSDENKELGYFEKSVISLKANEKANITFFIKPYNELKSSLFDVFSVSKNGKMSNILNVKSKLIIEEHTKPKASFKLFYKNKEATKIYIGNEIFFDAKDSSAEIGNISEYIWDLGNGELRYGQIISYTYPEGTKEGNYNITLTVIDENGITGEKNMNLEILPIKANDSFELDLIFILLIVIGIVIITAIHFVLNSMKKLNIKMKKLTEMAANSPEKIKKEDKFDINLWKRKEELKEGQFGDINSELLKRDKKEFEEQELKDISSGERNLDEKQINQELPEDFWKPKKIINDTPNIEKNLSEKREKTLFVGDSEDGLWKPQKIIGIKGKEEIKKLNSKENLNDLDDFSKEEIKKQDFGNLEENFSKSNIDNKKIENLDGLKNDLSGIHKEKTEINNFIEVKDEISDNNKNVNGKNQIEDNRVKEKLDEDNELEKIEDKKEGKKKKVNEDDWWNEWKSKSNF